MRKKKVRDELHWLRIQDSMKAGITALEKIFEESPEKKAKTLKQRAEDLAKGGVEVEEGKKSLDVVEFLLAHEKYAIELRHIREVYPLTDITPLPCTPSFVAGIINVRGQIMSVVDIKKFFDLPDTGFSDLNHVIILKNEDMEFGILADRILGVSSLPEDDVQPPPPAFKDVRAEYLKGVTKDPLIILDGGRILGDKKIVVHEEL